MSEFSKKIDGPTDPAEESLAGRRRAGADMFGLKGMSANVNQLVDEARPIVLAVAEIVAKIKEAGQFSTDLQLPDGPIKITIHLPTDLPKV